MNQSLLIELGTEELPPKALKQLSDAFSATLSESLQAAGLLSDNTHVKSYASPRRLAIWMSEITDTQEDFSQIRKGPAVAAAFDDNGEPTRAAQGFAKSCGVEVADLGREKTDRGEWLVFEQNIAGKSITECAQEALNAAITQLPIPKRMRWGDKSAEFVRPVHWLIALHGETILELSALGLKANNTSRGHRFHHRDIIVINHADDYAGELRRCYVLADFSFRQERIKQQCEALASEAGGIVVLDPALLDEVTGLVEWPVSLLGKFDPAFLDVPREALIASMKDHQKYFHLTDKHGELLPAFITVSNIESSTPEKVLTGNERVLHARLSDGQFFWEQDKSHPLEDNAERLEQLLFHIKLGSMADKTRRLQNIGGQLAKLIGADVVATQRAASLCKLDLVSHMVGEFASLQGTMGRYYALHDGEDKLVADAIEQHYWPKFAGDKLPESGESLALALADRLDALVGIFASGEKPTGVKDPYALRRAALGVLRILIEKQLDIPLQTLLEITVGAYQGDSVKVSPDAETNTQLSQFILDRLRAYYASQGFDINTFNAVAAVEPARVYDFDRRIHAVSEFFQTEQSAATALAAANKRIANILKKEGVTANQYQVNLFTEAAEHELARVLESLQKSTRKSFVRQQYAQGLAELAQLQTPVDSFFDDVRVMDDDENVRNNRLGLLGALRELFLQVADISHLNVEG
ncbi:MAG: glycine--tRNA ligase subunit beta [Proteobacteria bacterium]|nr:glycine--tRNA ligase subunit beta [Pseudomonadota bacterium]